VVPVVTTGFAGVTGFTTTVCGVIVTCESEKSPAALKMRSQYVVVVVNPPCWTGTTTPEVGFKAISLAPCVVPKAVEDAPA
jgi:hypothetical protein